MDSDGFHASDEENAARELLRQAAILVETHDFLMKGLSEKLKRRFESRHIIREIRPRPRRREDFSLGQAGSRNATSTPLETMGDQMTIFGCG